MTTFYHLLPLTNEKWPQDVLHNTEQPNTAAMAFPGQVKWSDITDSQSVRLGLELLIVTHGHILAFK
jgi:hypothetical protein